MSRRRAPVSVSVCVLVLALLVALPCARAEEVLETHPDGTPHRRYGVDDAGRRHGRYLELHPNGQVAVRARYRQGVLNGVCAKFHANGRKQSRGVYRVGKLTGTYEEWSADDERTYKARYRDGRRHGKARAWRAGGEIASQVWSDGALVQQDGVRVFPRTRAEIERTLAEILGPAPEGDASPGGTTAAAALARLRAYRYVCGVPWADLVLDDECTRYAQAASRICAALGRITHEPPNPGWPAEEYTPAARGAAECNLHGMVRAEGSVDGYMDDSDPRNIQHVGHRCWSLNPAMKKTGFGEWQAQTGSWFTAMWATDESRGQVPRLDAICYPARGWMPLALFGPRHAWSVQLDPRDYPSVEPGKIEVRIVRLDDRYLPAPTSLELDHLGVTLDAHGLPICVIFRPARIDLSDGAMYAVRLSGLDAKAKAGRDTLQFFVRFHGPAR